ncbi:MAG: glycerol kinase GlpK [Alphaproteobacteria bacterium]|nr:glycerol kinase GlpK [Alphaproteobacteria bacterium]
MKKAILSIDQGTSSSRAILFNKDGEILGIHKQEIQVFYPQNGWVEQDPKEIVDTTVDVVRKAVDQSRVEGFEIVGVGITNQRETTIVWDRETGQPVYNAIVWQDRRTADFCTTLKGKKGLQKQIQERTGLVLDPYFSATKIMWILENVEGAIQAAESGKLLFGTVDSWLLWNLTDSQIHATDMTNASRAMLLDINTGKWCEKLLKIFDIPRSLMPDVRDNISDYGQLKASICGLELTIGGVAGDQQAALIGQACLDSGKMKSTYGTGCFCLMHIGADSVLSKHKLLTTISSCIDGNISYALEGSIFNAGTAIQFLRDNLGFFDDAKESETLAKSVENNGGVFFVPAFTGLGAPYWNPEARGVICGLGRNSTPAHITRAALEAQAYQTRDLITAMEQDSGQKITALRIDGGLAQNDFMAQFMSDLLGVVITVPRVTESTAWGVACLAGVQSGLFSSLKETAQQWKAEKTFEPQQDRTDMDKLYELWTQAVEKSG